MCFPCVLSLTSLVHNISISDPFSSQPLRGRWCRNAKHTTIHKNATEGDVGGVLGRRAIRRTALAAAEHADAVAVAVVERLAQLRRFGGLVHVHARAAALRVACGDRVAPEDVVHLLEAPDESPVRCCRRGIVLR